MAVLDHCRIVDGRHIGHAAVAMPSVEIAAEERILFGCGFRPRHGSCNVAIELRDPPEIPRGAEFTGLDADRHAGAAFSQAGR